MPCSTASSPSLEERRTEYLLVGGIALLQYVEGRNTEDIDLIMALSSLERLPEVRKVGEERDFARGDFEGLRIDLLLDQQSLSSRPCAAGHATRQRVRRAGASACAHARGARAS